MENRVSNFLVGHQNDHLKSYGFSINTLKGVSKQDCMASTEGKKGLGRYG